MSNETILVFLRECVKLCVYMNANDPPVVLECPGWSSQRSPCQVFPSSTGLDEDALETRNQNVDKIELDIGFTTDDINKGQRKIEFNKQMFKDYTQRGNYLSYIVWPALFLCKGGSILSKGVAQGTNDQ